MAKDADHLTDMDEYKAHIGSTDKESGACLWGHDAEYRKNWSCSYRWQAHDFSKTNAQRIKIHNKSVDNALASMPSKVGTSAYPTSSSGLFPSQYATKINKPRQGSDWYLAGPLVPGYKPFGSKAIPCGENFTQFCWPYWHNSHHLIPKGTLNNEINLCTSVKFDMPKTIRLALLMEKYNINHYENVLILPQDTEVARWLELPRHLILMDGNPLKPAGLQIETTNHKEYNDLLTADLKKIFNAFKKGVERSGCHTQRNRTAMKNKLKKLEKACLRRVLAFGKREAGMPISGMKWKKLF